MSAANTALTVRVNNVEDGLRQQAAYEAACAEGLLDKLALGVMTFGKLADTGENGEKVKFLEFDNVCAAISLSTGALEVVVNKETVIDDSGENKLQAVVFDIGDGSLLLRIFAHFAQLEAQASVAALRDQRRAAIMQKQRENRAL